MDNRGFTFVEVLLVLTAFLMLMAIGFTFPAKLIKQQEANHFLNRFQHDVLYLQSLNMYETSSAFMTISPQNHQYTIHKSDTAELLVKRNIPENWTVHLRTLSQPVMYSSNGTIKNPGSLVIETEEDSYKIVFPFGKGRSYIEKQ